MHTYSPLLASVIGSVTRMCDVRALYAAAERIHKKYTGTSSQALEGLAEHVAYVACRMPATFAACFQTLVHVKQVIPSFTPTSILDIGCGPGTFLLSSSLAFPSLNKGLGLERSEDFCSISKTVLSAVPAFAPLCTVIRWDLAREAEVKGNYDLMTASYAIGELSVQAQERWLKVAKEQAKVLIIVEPGTPEGWKCLMRCRDIVLSLGGSLLAPCPHAQPCPFWGSDAWCHEAVRLQRSALHKKLKGGQLGYEDEKFSYLAVTFDPSLPKIVPPCRIVHAPRHRHGHTHLVLCTHRGQLEPTIISRKYKELYRLTREAKWGDSLPTMKDAIDHEVD
jgi:ribosomal protein RSM22 (predicted rRNA methylase)